MVDLGFGATPTTTIEMLARLSTVQPNLSVLGIDIDRDRVSQALPFAADNLFFAVGGFEVAIPNSLRFSHGPSVIRAMNVLRQYDEDEVKPAWNLMKSRLAPNGIIVEGTCDEIGRVGSWVTVTEAGPKWLTISLQLRGLAKPSKVAERLPKILIHRNIEGEPIHELLKDLDEAWASHSSLGIFSPGQRFAATATHLRAKGWPIVFAPKRWRAGELTLAWESVAPLNFR